MNQTTAHPIIEPADRTLNMENPLLTFLEEEVPEFVQKNQIELKKNLSKSGKNSDQFNLPQEQKEILKKNIGKLDGYTDMRGLEPIRKFMSEKFNEKFQDLSQNITQNDVFLTFGIETAFWLVFSSLLEENDKILLPRVVDPAVRSIVQGLRANTVEYSNLDNLEQHKDISVLMAFNPSFLNYNTEITQGEAIQLLKKAKADTIPLVVQGDYDIFIQNNKDIQANIVLINNQFDQFPGFKTAEITLVGSGLKDVNQGLINLSNVILMTNTPLQTSYVELINSFQSQSQALKEQKIQHQNQISAELKKIETYTVLANTQFDQQYVLLKSEKYFQNDKQFCLNFLKNSGILLVPGSFYGLQNSVLVNFLAGIEDYQDLTQSLIKQFQQ